MSDLISRQAAIDAISSMFAPTPVQKDMVEDCLEIIEELPSAEPKTGKWIRDKKPYYVDGKIMFEFVQLYCSECRALRRIGWHDAKFCPNCGAKMKDGE